MNESESHELIELVRRIRDLGRTVLLIEHDMHVVMGSVASLGAARRSYASRSRR